MQEFRGPALEVLAWIEARDWRGHDPFDLLLSPWALPFRMGRWPSVAWIQMGRRAPLDLRRILSVPPHENPKAVALGVQGCLALRGTNALAAVPGLVDRLLAAERPGGGWGYPFPWANRHFAVGAHTPSSVATAFVGHALLDAEESGLGAGTAVPAVTRGCAFMAERLQRVPAEGGFLLSYTPDDQRGVHNASLLAASLLARTAHQTGHRGWDGLLEPVVAATVRAQQPDGSWPYGLSRRDAFVDSFHTGYVLSALKTIAATGLVGGLDPVIDRGLAYWSETFLSGPAVAHRPGTPTPVDLHAVAQAILTCIEFRDRWPSGEGHARRLARWALEHARNDDGTFVYLWTPGRVNRVRYLRWVQAWMFRALAQLTASGDRSG